MTWSQKESPLRTNDTAATTGLFEPDMELHWSIRVPKGKGKENEKNKDNQENIQENNMDNDDRDLDALLDLDVNKTASKEKLMKPGRKIMF